MRVSPKRIAEVREALQYFRIENWFGSQSDGANELVLDLMADLEEERQEVERLKDSLFALGYPDPKEE